MAKKIDEYRKWMNDTFSRAQIEIFVKKHKKNYMSEIWGEILLEEDVDDPEVFMEELDRCRYDCRLNGTDLRQIEKFFGYPIN